MNQNMTLKELASKIDMKKMEQAQIRTNILSLEIQTNRECIALERIEGEIEELNREILSEQRRLRRLWEKAWDSDNPNIVKLRDEILLASKLIEEDS